MPVDFPQHPSLGISHTRTNMMKRCPRSWWIRYVGYWNGWNQDAPAKVQKAYRLGKLESIATWTGKLAHRGISELLREPGKTVHSVLTPIAAEARSAFRFSKAHGAGRFGPPKEFRLEEHYFGKALPDDCVEGVLSDVEACLTAFTDFCDETPQLDFRRMAAEAAQARRFLHIDNDRISFSDRELKDARIAGGEVSVWSAPDFIVETDEQTLLLLDWKTGGRWGPGDEDNTDLTGQLLNYAAGMQLRHPTVLAGVKHIEAFELHFPTKQYRGRAISMPEIDQAIAAMDRDARHLVALRGSASRVPADACPPAPEANKCRFCSFREICPEGAEITR